MVKRSLAQSRRALLLSGGAAALLGPSAAKAQFFEGADFSDLMGMEFGDAFGGVNISPPVDDTIEQVVETPTRLWDAVAEYVKDDTELLAPRVQEFVPADPPMPHMKSTAELEEAGAVFTADIERSNATGKLQAVDKPDNYLYGNATDFPDGFILNIPAGEYTLNTSNFISRMHKGFNLGPRYIFRGETGPNGERPILNFANGALSVSSHRDVDTQNTFAGFEVYDVEMKSDSVGLDAGPGPFLRYFRYDNVLFSTGFKNGNHPGNWPGVGIYNNCTFARSGRGGGLTHTFYGSYSQSLIFRNCLFTSPKGQGHPLKVYAQNVDMRGCTLASWWHTEDLEDGFYGEQAPMDIGAWGQSFIQGCHFVRRGVAGKTRNTPFIDYRNRLWEKGADKYRLPDFGTDAAEVDYHDVNNEVGTANEADPADQKLFRHVLIDNKFFNGILPDGGLDAEIDRRPGYFVRNNGTIFNWANGQGRMDSSDPSYRLTPTDYTVQSERAVLYVRNNEITGVPVQSLYPGPYNHTADPAPVVELTANLPDWVQERVNGTQVDNHWWDTAWNSPLGPQL